MGIQEAADCARYIELIEAQSDDYFAAMMGDQPSKLPIVARELCSEEREQWELYRAAVMLYCRGGNSTRYAAERAVDLLAEVRQVIAEGAG